MLGIEVVFGQMRRILKKDAPQDEIRVFGRVGSEVCERVGIYSFISMRGAPGRSRRGDVVENVGDKRMK